MPVQAKTGTYLTLEIQPSATVKKGDTVEFWARLFDSSGNVVLYKTLKFYVDGNYVDKGQGTGSGWVSIPYTVNLNPGPHEVKVVFEGDIDYDSSYKTRTLTVMSASKPRLINVGISPPDYNVPITPPITVIAGGEFKAWYQIENPDSNSVGVILGLSIYDPNGNRRDDPSNDKVVTLPPSTTYWYWRKFRVEQNAVTGSYKVEYGVWKTDWSEKYDGALKDGWLIVSQTSTGYIRVTVVNNDDDSVDVSLYIDGSYKGTAYNIAPGSSYTFQDFPVDGNLNHEAKITWREPDTSKDYEQVKTVYVGSGQIVSVSFTIPLIVSDIKKPDLTITRINLMPYSSDQKYAVGQTIDINPTVVNEGSADANNIKVSVYVDDKFLGNLPYFSLKAGESTSGLGKPWTVTEGKHIIKWLLILIMPSMNSMKLIMKKLSQLKVKLAATSRFT
jgi:hypothetical protein